MTIRIEKCTEKTELVFSPGRLGILVISLAGLFFCLEPLADSNVATLTQLQGTVKIFTHPSKLLPKVTRTTASSSTTHPHVLFEGEYYQIQDAQIGDRVERGNIVRTAPGSKVRLVYPNGDQIHVSPGTAYRVFWEDKNPKDSKNSKGSNPAPSTQIQLMYGKLRGIIEKGGPRSHLQIRTRTAVLGVRGTDFYIEQDDLRQSTHYSILRGTVEVTPRVTRAKPILVHAGYTASASVAEPGSKSGSESGSAQPQVQIRKTTQEDLVLIQKSSTMTQPSAQSSSAPGAVSPAAKTAEEIETEKRVALLEKKASETTLKDIQMGDPKLYEALQKNPKVKVSELTVADLNEVAVQNIFKNAPKETPKAPEKRKPELNELDHSQRDEAYEKYFRIIEE